MSSHIPIIPNELDKDKYYVLHFIGIRLWIVWYEDGFWGHGPANDDSASSRSQWQQFGVSSYSRPLFGLEEDNWTLGLNYSELPGGICAQCPKQVRFGVADYLCDECRS